MSLVNRCVCVYESTKYIIYTYTRTFISSTETLKRRENVCMCVYVCVCVYDVHRMNLLNRRTEEERTELQRAALLWEARMRGGLLELLGACLCVCVRARVRA